jgi:hypothetical protein
VTSHPALPSGSWNRATGRLRCSSFSSGAGWKIEGGDGNGNAIGSWAGNVDSVNGLTSGQ